MHFIFFKVELSLHLAGQESALYLILKLILLWCHVCLLLQKIIERRLLSFKFGDPTVKMNWIHVENFVQAHILAAGALTAERNFIAVSTQ